MLPAIPTLGRGPAYAPDSGRLSCAGASIPDNSGLVCKRASGEPVKLISAVMETSLRRDGAQDRNHTVSRFIHVRWECGASKTSLPRTVHGPHRPVCMNQQPFFFIQNMVLLIHDQLAAKNLRPIGNFHTTRPHKVFKCFRRGNIREQTHNMRLLLGTEFHARNHHEAACSPALTAEAAFRQELWSVSAMMSYPSSICHVDQVVRSHIVVSAWRKTGVQMKIVKKFHPFNNSARRAPSS